MNLITLRIKKDNLMIKYIKMIRAFDASFSIGDLKRSIEEDKDVITFDLEKYDVLDDINEIDRKKLFRELINSLCLAGASISIYQNKELISIPLLDNWLNTMNETRQVMEDQQDLELN